MSWSLPGVLMERGRRVARAGPARRSPLPVNFAPVPNATRRRQAMLNYGGAGALRTMETAIEAYGSLGTLFGVVGECAVQTASAEWKLWRKAPSGKDEDRVEVTEHAALSLWKRPNPFMAQSEFVETGQQHVDLTGEWYWLCVNVRGLTGVGPLELWPIRPDRIRPVPHPTRFLAGYLYISPDGEKIPLRLDAVIQIRVPNPADPYRGMGPVQALMADIDAARYSAEWNRNFFMNSAMPGGVVEVPETWNDDEYDRFQEAWRDQHQGAANAHRVAVLEGGAKWVERKYSMTDMQFTQLRDLSRELIREAYRFPKFGMGLVDDVNRATADASLYALGQIVAKPRCRRIKDVLNNELLPMFGPTADDLEFDFTLDLPADREADDRERLSKAQAAALLVKVGFDDQDVCAAMGLPIMRWTAPVASSPSDDKMSDNLTGAGR
jgi:HK97 family phage portal protein